MSSVFPFSAVVANDDLKLALILVGIDPRIGGVLIEGEKGTAKTTLARGLGELLPPPAKFVELPLGTSEDRLKGSVDLEHLVRDKSTKLSQGLLGQANGGVLYVDEVNLLADHLVDIVLDVATSGENRIERDNLSIVEPAQFVLIGSMNREEGWLRPQLLDRFGLYVAAKPISEGSLRIEATKRRLEYDADPAKFCARYKDLETELSKRIEVGRKKRSKSSTGLCAEMTPESWDAVENHIITGGYGSLRADLVLVRAACAYAQWLGEDRVDATHVAMVAPLVLGHRKSTQARGDSKDQPNSDGSTDEDKRSGLPKDKSNRKSPGSQSHPKNHRDASEGNQSSEILSSGHQVDQCGSSTGTKPAKQFDQGHFDLDSADSSRVDVFGASQARKKTADSAMPSRRPNASVVVNSGTAHIGSELLDRSGSKQIDVTASIRNSVMQSAAADNDIDGIGVLYRQIRQSYQARLLIVVLDASGSMGLARRIAMAKEVLVSALETSYQRRNRVALVSFSGETATLALGSTRSVELVTRKLSTITSGGYSPIDKGLEVALEVSRQAAGSGLDPVILVISDCRATSSSYDALQSALVVARALAVAQVETIFIDLEVEHPRLGLAKRLADSANGKVLSPFE